MSLYLLFCVFLHVTVTQAVKKDTSTGILFNIAKNISDSTKTRHANIVSSESEITSAKS